MDTKAEEKTTDHQATLPQGTKDGADTAAPSTTPDGTSSSSSTAAADANNNNNNPAATTATPTDPNNTTTKAVPTQMFGNEAAMEEMARQEFESQRALANVERAIAMQRQLTNSYGWDGESARVLGTLDAQRNVQKMRMAHIAVQRQRLLTGLSAAKMPFGTQTTLGGTSRNGFTGGFGMNTMNTMNPGMMNTMNTGMMNTMNTGMNTMNNTGLMGTRSLTATNGTSMLNNTGTARMTGMTGMTGGGAFGTNMKIQQLRMMEQEQNNATRMRQQLRAREQQLMQSRQKLSLEIQKEAMVNQQRAMQMQQRASMMKQQQYMATQQSQRATAMLQQVQRQAYAAQSQAQTMQFQQQQLEQQAMFAKQAAAATASYAPNMNGGGMGQSMMGGMGGVMNRGNRWATLRAPGTATNRSMAMSGAGMGGGMLY